jgi:hypothetical protein
MNVYAATQQAKLVKRVDVRVYSITPLQRACDAVVTQ